MNANEAQKLVASVPHWYQKFAVAPGVVTPGAYDPKFVLDKMHLPADLSGCRVLDIGASDGFFSLEARKRGADVTAVDYRAKGSHGFAVMEKLSGLKFNYRQINIYDVSQEEFGNFDHVFFLNVLYHLPDMLRGLLLMHNVCSTYLYLETHYSPDIGKVALARYYRGATLSGDITNFWSPNVPCIHDMLSDVGFNIEHEETWGDRYFAVCKAEHTTENAKLATAYGLL